MNIFFKYMCVHITYQYGCLKKMVTQKALLLYNETLYLKTRKKSI